jgi:hypothetical protein
MNAEQKLIFHNGSDDEVMSDDEPNDPVAKFFKAQSIAAGLGEDGAARFEQETTQRHARVSKHYRTLAAKAAETGAAPAPAGSVRKVAKTESDGHTRREYDAAGKVVREIEFSLNDLSGVASEFDERGVCVKTYSVAQSADGAVQAVV